MEWTLRRHSCVDNYGGRSVGKNGVDTTKSRRRRRKEIEDDASYSDHKPYTDRSHVTSNDLFRDSLLAIFEHSDHIQWYELPDHELAQLYYMRGRVHAIKEKIARSGTAMRRLSIRNVRETRENR